MTQPSVLIGGLDEVGFGALAGPIISVVAVFDDESRKKIPSTVTDSKRVTEKMRRMLYPTLCSIAVDVGIGWAEPWEIDSMGVFPSLQLSYTRALSDLDRKPDILIVDGNNRVGSWKGKQQVEPKADLNYQEVSAASIIAKHFRDSMMESLARLFPGYGWERNAGYGTKDHEDGIRKYGLLVDEVDKSKYLHRRRYCRNLMVRGA